MWKGGDEGKKKHYDGDVESDKWIQAAKQKNENIFYKVENSFYYEEYCTSITENY